ncbi:MAG TPA: VOC family protein [Pseudonocardiaceae bacterium]
MEMTPYEPGTPSWVDLGSPDPVASAAFYSALFGWDAMDGGPEAGGYRMCSLGGKPVAGIGAQQQTGMRPYWTTYVSVADAAATTEKVRKAGGKVFMEPMEVIGFGHMAVFADPTGAAISVWQPLRHIGAGLVNEPGTLCWNELTTREPDLAVPFYRDVFGWGARPRQMGPVTYTEWTLGEKAVASMMPMDGNWPADLPSHWMVYFAVADTDAAAARVAELGGTVHVPPSDIPPGRFAVVTDPHEAAFSLITMNPQDG